MLIIKLRDTKKFRNFLKISKNPKTDVLGFFCVHAFILSNKIKCLVINYKFCVKTSLIK